MAEVDNVGQDWKGICFVFLGGPHLFKMADNGSPYFQSLEVIFSLNNYCGFMFIFSPQDVVKLEETSKNRKCSIKSPK